MKINKAIVTESGMMALKLRILETEKRIAEIRAEKEIAYLGSGDGWHDNPGYNQLEQLEFQVCSELNELQSLRDNCFVAVTSVRNTDVVAIGSIIKVEQTRAVDGLTSTYIWEIVGHKESEPRKFKIAYDTPLGKSLLGLSAGKKVEVTLPNGKVVVKTIEFYRSWEEVTSETG